MPARDAGRATNDPVDGLKSGSEFDLFRVGEHDACGRLEAWLAGALLGDQELELAHARAPG